MCERAFERVTESRGGGGGGGIGGGGPGDLLAP